MFRINLFPFSLKFLITAHIMTVKLKIRKNSGFWLLKSNGSRIPFGRLQKIWSVIWGDAIFYSFKSVTLIWGYFAAGCSPTKLNFRVLYFCTRFPPGLSVLMVRTLLTFWDLLPGNLSLSFPVKLLGETMVQTDAMQHCWWPTTLNIVDVTCCVRLHTLLHVVGCCWAKFKTGQTFSPG